MQVYTDKKGKNYVAIKFSECKDHDTAIRMANNYYFKIKKDELDYAKGYVYNGILKVDSTIRSQFLNVWVVARK